MKEEREGRWDRSILERKNKKNTSAKTVSWITTLQEKKNKETERRKASAQSLEKLFPELRNEVTRMKVPSE